MSKIRIGGILTHSKKGQLHGVDLIRIVLPLETLAKMYPDEFSVKTMVAGPLENGYKDWDELCKDFDILYFSYLDNPVGYIQMKVAAIHQKTKIVIDLDDNIWEIPRGNPVREHFMPGGEALDVASKVLEDVEFITTTNIKLKYAIAKYCGRKHEDIMTLPNFVSTKYYDCTKMIPKTRPEIVIWYAGTTTHQLDVLQPMFMNALVRIVEKYPNVVYRTIGNSFLPQIKTAFMKVGRGKNYESYGGKPDVYEWFDLWAKELSQADIVTAPLFPSVFTECKSDCKLKEFALSKLPGVYQNIRNYKDHLQFNPEWGILAGTEDEWFNGLERLILDADLRKSMGEKLYDYVVKEHTIEGNIEMFGKYFTGIVNK